VGRGNKFLHGEGGVGLILIKKEKNVTRNENATGEGNREGLRGNGLIIERDVLGYIE
jgi:hypothetical protein